MFWVGGDFLDSRFFKVAGKIFFNVLYAIIYIIRAPLGEHLNGAVPKVADEAGQLTATGRPAGGETKADTLNSAGENYMLGNHLSYCVLRISYCVIEPIRVRTRIIIPLSSSCKWQQQNKLRFTGGGKLSIIQLVCNIRN